MSHVVLLVIATLINFAILAFAIMKFVVPTFKTNLGKKRQNIIAVIEETEKSLADMSQELESQRTKLHKMDEEIAQIHVDAGNRATAAARKIQEDTQVEVEQLRKRIDGQMQQEVNNLKQNLRQEFVGQVLKTAEEMAIANLSRATHANLVEQFALKLKEAK